MSHVALDRELIILAFIGIGLFISNSKQSSVNRIFLLGYWAPKGLKFAAYS